MKEMSLKNVLMNEMFTKQEVFDYVAKKLLEQGTGCIDGTNGTCLYDDGKGKHCAIGWLLDEKEMETARVSFCGVQSLRSRLGYSSDLYADTFLLNLQCLHDDIAQEESPETFKEHFVEGMIKLAAKHGLDHTSCLEQA